MPPKKNPLGLNPLQLKTLTLLQEVARLENAPGEEPGFVPDRPQDRTFVGNIVQAMEAYASGALGEQPIPFNAADRLMAIGSDRMMAAVAQARHGVLKPHLKPHHFAIGSINSPMQCTATSAISTARVAASGSN